MLSFKVDSDGDGVDTCFVAKVNKFNVNVLFYCFKCVIYVIR